MAEIIDKLVDISPFEQGLDSLGMGTPTRRFIIGFAVGSIIVWALRPSVAFDDGERPRSWALIDSSDPANATSLPWWGLAAIPGVLFSTFI